MRRNQAILLRKQYLQPALVFLIFRIRRFLQYTVEILAEKQKGSTFTFRRGNLRQKHAEIQTGTKVTKIRDRRSKQD